MEAPSQLRFRLMAAAVLALFLVLAFGTAVTKAPWCDEGWFASPAFNLAFKGFMGTTVLDPASGTPTLHTRTRLDGIDRYTYWVMPLDLVTQAGWYKLVGFSLLRMRVLSILWGLVALVCWWIVFHELSGNRYTALLAVALLEVEYMFVWIAVDGRMDMQCQALGVAGLAVYLRLRERSLARALFAANALIAASGLTHPNGDLYFVALVCLVLMFDRRRLQWRYLVICGIPYVIGAALWLPYVMKAPDLFKIQILGNAAGRESAFTAPLSALHREARRYLDAFGFAPWSQGFAHLSILELLAFAGGVTACAAYSPLRRQLAARLVFTITAAICVFLWLFEGAKISTYLTHVVPWFCFALAFAAADFWIERRGPRIVPALAVTIVFVLAVARIAVPAIKDNYHRRFLPAAEYLRQNASPAELIMGSAELVFHLGMDWNILDDIMMGTTTGKSARYIVMDSRYADYLQSIRVTAPEAYERSAQQLRDRYEKVYDQAAYQIYRRVH